MASACRPGAGDIGLHGWPLRDRAGRAAPRGVRRRARPHRRPHGRADARAAYSCWLRATGWWWCWPCPLRSRERH